jgi:hypothetical protein
MLDSRCQLGYHFFVPNIPWRVSQVVPPKINLTSSSSERRQARYGHYNYGQA